MYRHLDKTRYRPKGVEKARADYCQCDGGDCECSDCQAFETGADAMLEGLIENHGRKVEQGYDTDSLPLGFVADGIYIELFIPEEKG